MGDMPGETIDFGALAARLSDIDGVRACLLMSRDGLTLGVHPADREDAARVVWERMHSIGDPQRGFLTVGDELWIITRRGPYAGIVVAGPSATPGLLLDRLEFSLRAAEELRLREGSAAAPRTEGARKPRSPLHPEVDLAPDAPPLELVGAATADAVSAAIQIASMREGPLTLAPVEPAGSNGNGKHSEVGDLKLRPLETEAVAEPEPEPEPDPEPEAEVDPAPEPDPELEADPDPEPDPKPELRLAPDPEPEPQPDHPEQEPQPEVDIQLHPVSDESLEKELEVSVEEERAHVSPRRDEPEVDPVALAREFKNLFDRPDD